MENLKQLLKETQERNKYNRKNRTYEIYKNNYIICKYIARYLNCRVNTLIEYFSQIDVDCNFQPLIDKGEKMKTTIEIDVDLIEKYKIKFKMDTFKDTIYEILVKTLNYMWKYHKDLYNKALETAREEINNPPKRKKVCNDKDEYIDFIYNEKEMELFNNTILTKDDETKISKIKNSCKGKKNYYIAKEMYIMWKNNYSPEEIANVYGKSSRIFQKLFKDVGINRDRYEAQAIASTKRDYMEIQLKGRQTMLKNNTSIFGSKQEVYLRTLLNCKLPMEFQDSEVIVGLNNKSILNDGKEIDIPILIINNNNTYKFAVEYNGDFWHEEDKDNYKSNLAYKKGYKLFYIQPKPHATDKQIKEQIESDIDNIIIQSIKDEMSKLKQLRKDVNKTHGK